MTISVDCERLIAEAEQFHPLYGDRLANHLPMALIALDRMCASPAQMRRFYSHYCTRLRPRGESGEPLEPLSNLGNSEAFAGVLLYFRNDVEREGVEFTVRKWLPVLIPGLAASAFHCL